MVDQNGERLLRAEREGLRLALMARTAIVGLGFVWYLTWALQSSASPLILWAFVFLFCVGLGHLILLRSNLDRPWMKYAVYAVDVWAICASFAFGPLSSAEDVPQILVYRTSGIYHLFPLIAMAALSLSPRLVVWTGLCVVTGWWAGFLAITAGQTDLVNWADLGRLGYQELILHPNFAGRGNRIEETAMTLVAALILALAVTRARSVFFAQIEAEAGRRKATDMLGQFVPEDVADDILREDAALSPRITRGAVLILDIAGFSQFSATRPPEEVIAALNAFLAEAGEAVHGAGGVVITYTGDGLLASFNTPRSIDDPEAAALRAAEALLDTAERFAFSVRIGLASGDLAAGSVGSSARRAFTVYGDTVNRAARLEALAKDLGETVLMDAAMTTAAADARPLGPHGLRGLGDAVEVYAPVLRRRAISTAK